MTSMTAAGTTIAISAALPPFQTHSGYAGLSFIEVGQVEKVGALGATFAKAEFQPLKGPKQKYKASNDNGTLTPVLALDSADAGQALLRTASDDASQKLYSFRLTFPDGALRYFLGRVLGMPEAADGADTILTGTPTIEICTRVVRVVAGAPVPAPDAAPFALSNNRSTVGAPVGRDVGVVTGVQPGATVSLVSDASGCLTIDNASRELRIAAIPTTAGSFAGVLRRSFGGVDTDLPFTLQVLPIVANDTFAAGTGVEINGRALGGPGGKVWSGATGNWSIDGNGRAQHNRGGTSSNDRMLFDAGMTEYLIEAICRSQIASNGTDFQLAEIQFRATETTAWRLRTDARRNRISLSYVTGIDRTTGARGVDAVSYFYHQPLNGAGLGASAIRLGVKVKGNTITPYFNRVEMPSIVDERGASDTLVGFASAGAGTSGAATCTVDDFVLEPACGIHVNWPVWTPTSITTPKVPLGSAAVDGGGNPTSWDYTDVNNPQPFRDPIGNRWLMAYSGYGNGAPANANPGRFDGSRVQHLGLVSAASLAGPWTKFSTTQPTIVADPTLDQIYAFNGGSQYSEALGLFINVGVTSNGVELGLWTSPTAAVGSWTRQGVIRSKSGVAIGGAFDGALEKLPDGSFELVYAAEQTNGAGGTTATRAMCRMTSPTGALGTWVDDPANPIMYPRIGAQAVGAAWDQHLGEFQQHRIPEQPSQIIVHFDGVLKRERDDTTATDDRHAHAAVSFDNGKTWRYRLDALKPQGTGYMSVQVFDTHMMRDPETGGSRLFYAAAPRQGAALNIFIELGDATAPLVTNLAA